jgi:peptidoglycan/LPS O-acetylase OafA/YrhL
MSKSTSNSAVSGDRGSGDPGYARRAALTVGSVLLANLVVRGVGSVAVPELADFDPLGWGPVIATSVVVGLGAVVAVAVLKRLTASADRAFLALAVVGLALSLVPVFVFAPTLPGVTPAIQAVMVVMHLVTAAAAVVALRRTCPSPRS